MQRPVIAAQVSNRSLGGGSLPLVPRLPTARVSTLQRRSSTQQRLPTSGPVRATATAAAAAPAPTSTPSQPSAAGSHSEAAPAGGAEQPGAADEQQQQQQLEEGQQPPQQQQEYIEIEVTTEEEVEIEDQGFQPRQAVHQAHTYLTGTSTGQALSLASAGLLLAAAATWAYRQYQQANTDKARRKRQIERNNLLIKELNKFLPDKRFKLNDKIVKDMKRSTGFDSKEVFRKYLWYLLNERPFTQEAVEDLLVLKETAGLSDVDVADALAERAQRVYDKYGTLLLNTQGFTSSGQQRKTACRELGQKILFLAECDALVKRGSEAEHKINLRVIFGASEEDMAQLRTTNIAELSKAVDPSEQLSYDELEEPVDVEEQLPHPPKTALDSQ